MKEYIFDTVIIGHEKVNSGYIEFPFDVMMEFGKKGQVKVKAYFDGFEYRGSLVKMGTPCHIIGLKKTVRDAIRKQPGETVHVIITEDTDERLIDTPDDLGSALKGNPAGPISFRKTFVYTPQGICRMDHFRQKTGNPCGPDRKMY